MNEATRTDTNAGRDETIRARVSQDEKDLVRRCAEHFAGHGIAEAGASDFLRSMVYLYAEDHGLPLFAGDRPGSIGENEDRKKLAAKHEKIGVAVRRVRARAA